MRNLAKTCAVVALCLSLTGGVRAADRRPRPRMPRAPMYRPVAMVSAPQKPLVFAKVAGSGPARLKAQTAVLAVANCRFRVLASFRALVGETGQRAAIHSKALKVTINGKDVPIGTEFVEIATGGPTPPSGAEVPITVEIKTAGALAYPAGRYGGDLKIAVRGG